MRTSDLDRRLPLEGAWNFRDLGGYVGSGGRAVRWHRIYRADGLDRLTESDLRTVADLRLRTVIDLRTEDEVTQGRLAPEAGHAEWHHLPMLDVLPPQEDYDSWVGPAFVAGRYLAMLEGASGSVATFLELLSDPDAYPVVYHCFAGKDRTGILTAMVLGLLGVDDNDIELDYALSKVAMGPLLDWLRAKYADNASTIDSSSAAIVAAEPETMAHFLALFRRAHGSWNSFAASLGHETAAEVLRDLLLES